MRLSRLALLGIGGAIVFGAPGICLASALQESGCTTAREYVTTLEYLRSRDDFKIPEANARKLAGEVASACSGAANRFIRVTETLVKAGLSGQDAVRTGLQFATRLDRETETFIIVFRYAFLSEYLDLDIRSAMKMAHSLSTEFEGDVLAVRQDFEEVLRFCVEERDLDLPRPQCGALAARIAKRGGAHSGGIGRAFVESFRFLSSSGGAGLITSQALLVAEELSSSGPGYAENFIHGYKYAISAGGLGLNAHDAMGFARQMAGQTTRKVVLKRQ